MSIVKSYLEDSYSTYHTSTFIVDDPISIPKSFTNTRDIEIIGLWTAVLSWGLRKTIINKGKELCRLMHNEPFDFIMNHTEQDLRKITTFKHRTFNDTDTLCFIDFFKWYYSNYSSLEEAFIVDNSAKGEKVEAGINNFHQLFINAPGFIDRSKKHIASPAKNSSCKRINMFLRWMVRKDDAGIDFGIWQKLSMSELMIPLDIHVYRVAIELKLLKRKKTDWKAVKELTQSLRKFDPDDPVRYDYALFSLGVHKKLPFS